MRPLSTSTFFENLGQDADLAMVGHVEDRSALRARELHLVEVWAAERKRKREEAERRLSAKEKERRAKAKAMRDRKRLEDEFSDWAKERGLVWSNVRRVDELPALEAEIRGQVRYYIPQAVALVFEHGPSMWHTSIEKLPTLLNLVAHSAEYAELVEGTYHLGGKEALRKLLVRTRAHPRG